jgi:recombination protein RecA
MAKVKEVKDERAERIARICGAINKSSFGGENGDAVMWLGSRDALVLERFSSGEPGLDDALGGGWPKGRFIEIFGPESGGKTTLTLHAIAEFQKKYPNEDCALIDTEYTFDEWYAQRLGVNTKYLIVHQPDAGEQALNVLEMLIKQGVAMIIVDSVAALTTRAELEGDIGDTHVGEQARLMSQALRRLTMEAGKHGATVLWTNQMRDKIGVTWGDKTTTPAGRALKHYASVRVHIVAIGKVKEKVKGEDVVVSTKNKASVKKNKTAPPFKVAEFCISFGHGIDRVAGILDNAIAFKVVKKSGAWFSFNGVDASGNTGLQLGQGRAQTLVLLRKDAELLGRIEADLIAAKEAGVAAEIADDVELGDPKAGDDPDSVEAGEAEEGAEEQDV